MDELLRLKRFEDLKQPQCDNQQFLVVKPDNLCVMIQVDVKAFDLYRTILALLLVLI